MKPPEMTQEARREVAAALAVLHRHHVEAFRTSGTDWPDRQQGFWVIPFGSAHEQTQAFRPFFMGKAELPDTD